MGIRLKDDKIAVAPIIWAIVLIGSAIAGLGVYQVTQRPDVTYNISDTGFSFAGVDISWLLIIGVGAIALFVFLWIAKRKPQSRQPQLPYNRNGRY